MHLKKFLSGDAQFKYPIMSFYKIGMNEFQQNVISAKTNIVSFHLLILYRPNVAKN